MKTRIAILFLLGHFTLLNNCFAEIVWQQKNVGINDLDILFMDIFVQDERSILACSPERVYISTNGADFWREIFSLTGQEKRINLAVFDRFNRDAIYVATSRGLYISRNQGQDWVKAFSRASESENNVRWIAFGPREDKRIYIGTEASLFISQDRGVSWERYKGGLPRSAVRAIAVHPNNAQVLYLANNYGLFKSIDGAKSWKRIYVASYKYVETEDENADEIADNDSDTESGAQHTINYIAIDKDNPRQLYLATSRGVTASADAGQTWQMLPRQGLINKYVYSVLLFGGLDEGVRLYAATADGVFVFLPESGRWQEVYQGMLAREVRKMSLAASKSQIFAATDKGIFKTVAVEDIRDWPVQQVRLGQSLEIQVQIEEDQEKNNNNNPEIDYEQIIHEISLREPSIQEVQDAALRYAEVIHPEKIRNLRNSARLKAFLPDVSLNYDKTVSVSTNPNYKERVVGPRDWGLSLSWDIGDLVFSEQIRLIDGNARLLVQLREDILDQVTRVYYERLKLQIDLELKTDQQEEERLAKILRVEELTANIDALTGGYFSRELKKRRSNF